MLFRCDNIGPILYIYIYIYIYMRRLEEQPPIAPKGVFEKKGFKVFKLYILISQKLFHRF